ncbi:MAG: YkgJ family cysteine cluster protein [Pseudomonadota bacterium]|uniref:YkgJ family cysteine cluster protein n=1 Tax=Sphingomonas sp. PL20 TaxID=2760712 RepID=UPI001AE39050
MTIHFDCTMCGRCCHNLKLPMSANEAITWLTRGGDVQLLCEASVYPDGQHQTQRDNYDWQRSFAASSGTLPVRIRMTFVGAFSGACPYLLADMRCGGYEDRPRVCRIYPAEVNPFAAIGPAGKSCPPEAWFSDQPVFAVNNAPVDRETRLLIDAARNAGLEDTVTKETVCVLLGVAEAAFANEGFAIHTPAPATLLVALKQAIKGPPVGALDWRIVTNRSSTLAMLNSADANAMMTSSEQTFEYHGFFAPDEAATFAIAA